MCSAGTGASGFGGRAGPGGSRISSLKCRALLSAETRVGVKARNDKSSAAETLAAEAHLELGGRG